MCVCVCKRCNLGLAWMVIGFTFILSYNIEFSLKNVNNKFLMNILVICGPDYKWSWSIPIVKEKFRGWRILLPIELRARSLAKRVLIGSTEDDICHRSHDNSSTLTSFDKNYWKHANSSHAIQERNSMCCLRACILWKILWTMQPPANLIKSCVSKQNLKRSSR